MGLSFFGWNSDATAGVSPGSGSSTTYFAHAGPLGSKADYASSNEAYRQIKMGGTATLEKLTAYIKTNARTTTTTIRLRKNSSNGNMNIAVSAGTTGWVRDDTNTDSVASGDLINFAIVTGASSENGPFIKVLMVWVNTGNGTAAQFYLGHSNNDYLTFGATTNRFGTVAGTNTAMESTERPQEIRCGFTVKKHGCYIRNTGSYNTRGATSTLKVRKNSADAGTGASVPTAGSGGINGWFEATETIAFSSGDDIGYSIDNASGQLFPQHFYIYCESDDEKVPVLAALRATGSSKSSTTTTYQNIFGDGGLGTAGTTWSTEADSQVKLPYAVTFSKLAVRIDTNSSPNTLTFTFRKNGSDGNQTCSAAATTTGWIEDTTNSDSCSVDDLVNLRCSATNASSHSMGMTSLVMERTGAGGGGGGGGGQSGLVVIAA